MFQMECRRYRVRRASACFAKMRDTARRHCALHSRHARDNTLTKHPLCLETDQINLYFLSVYFEKLYQDHRRTCRPAL